MSKPQQDPLLVRAKEIGDPSAPELVDRLCVEQRTRWLQGDSVRVETLLEQYPQMISDPECAFELIYSEFLLREELGKSASLDEFSKRFPEYTERLRRQLELHQAFESDVCSIEMFSDPAIETPDGSPVGTGTGVDRGTDEVIEGTGRFATLHRIGMGAMGVVYAAYDNVWHQTVALKTLRNVNATAIYHIKQEFRVLADLSHPNLVQLFELFSVRDQYFLTMELVDGVDFVAYCRLRRTGGEPSNDGFARVRGALRQLGEGLNALHQAGCLHCDVKPSNVLVTETGRVLLLDFGLAQRGDWNQLISEADSYLKGTAPYISPEQFMGSGASVQSDWYSVGVILYQVLTGHLPFAGTVSEVMAAKRLSEPQAPAELASGIPDDLNLLCLGLMRRDPRARPSGEDVLRQLGLTSREPTPLFSSELSEGKQDHFVGREQELEQLRESFQRVSEQRKPMSHFVRGSSGVGKTSLLRRFTRGIARRDDVLVFSGRCYEQESVPFKALDSVIDEICRYLRNMPQEQAASLLPHAAEALTRMFPVLERVQAVGSLETTEPPSRDPQLPQTAFCRDRTMGRKHGGSPKCC